jgi:hypothetical protein
VGRIPGAAEPGDVRTFDPARVRGMDERTGAAMRRKARNLYREETPRIAADAPPG